MARRRPDWIGVFWDIIDGLLAQQADRYNKTKTPLPLLDHTLYGYEFRAVEDSSSIYDRRKCRLNRKNGGWNKLAREHNMLVLFARGFKDIIKPRDDDGLCRRWRSMPKQEDYLATTITVLKNLRDVTGGEPTQKFLLASNLQWTSADSVLFEPCPTPATSDCQCDRLQQIVSESSNCQCDRLQQITSESYSQMDLVTAPNDTRAVIFRSETGFSSFYSHCIEPGLVKCYQYLKYLRPTTPQQLEADVLLNVDVRSATDIPTDTDIQLEPGSPSQDTNANTAQNLNHCGQAPHQQGDTHMGPDAELPKQQPSSTAALSRKRPFEPAEELDKDLENISLVTSPRPARHHFRVALADRTNICCDHPLANSQLPCVRCGRAYAQIEDSKTSASASTTNDVGKDSHEPNAVRLMLHEEPLSMR